jgi:integrase
MEVTGERQGTNDPRNFATSRSTLEESTALRYRQQHFGTGTCSPGTGAISQGSERTTIMRGDGRIFLRKGSSIYSCAYCLRGKEFRESTGETDPGKAMKFLRRKLKEVHADEIGASTFMTPQSRRLTVHDLLEMVKSEFQTEGKASPQNLSHLRRADADFGNNLAMALTSKHIEAYKEERRTAGDKPATINRPLQMIRQAYRLAVNRNELPRAPFIKLLSEEGNARQGFCSEQGLRAMLQHLPADLQDFVEFAAATGMRKSEAASLTWPMVQDGELQIPADVTKNRKARSIPIDQGNIAAIIKRRKAARRIEEDGRIRMVEYIFHWEGEPIREFRDTWARACVAARLGAMICPKCKGQGAALTCPACNVPTRYRGLIFHDLRRSAIRFMRKAGVATQVAKKWSGHVTDSIFQRYSILNTDDMRDAQKQTEDYREKTTESNVVTMGKK